MMRRVVGISAWEGRIAPLFDVSRHLVVLEVRDGRVTGRRTVALDAEEPLARARQVAELGVDLLVCGAVSRCLEELLTAHGVEVTAFVAGDAVHVEQAMAEGRPPPRAWALPGCRRRRRCRCGPGR